LHENPDIVDYLRRGVAQNRFEIMLHGYHHDDPTMLGEFRYDDHLMTKVMDGRKYLQDLLGTRVRLFVAPRNSIGRAGLRAVVAAGLHFGGTVGVRSGWSLLSRPTWANWFNLRRWRKHGGAGVPWILDLGDHREIPGNPVTPSSSLTRNKAAFETAMRVGGTFCVATHYWELGAPSLNPGEPTVGTHLRELVDVACSDPRVKWRTVGDVIMTAPTLCASNLRSGLSHGA
jgi:peptidoglycan/xylan/chitin deacetylase (PgdA/CDA1 family)